MPAYRQLGNRVSAVVDVKVEKKIRMSGKTYYPQLNFSLPNHLGKVSRPAKAPENGKMLEF
jgi:hypothetical protein